MQKFPAFTLMLSGLFATKALAADAPTASEPKLNYTVSWLGNTFAEPDKWVQMDAHAMYVAPDGTCYLNTPWEEGGRNVGIYKNGDVVGNAGHTHGWGYEGGAAVTANAQYLFIAQVVENEGGGLKAPTSWPPKGKSWAGVSRRHLDGSPAPFPGGKGGDGDTLKNNFLVENEFVEKTDGGIKGMAADSSRLYVASATDKIKVYDVNTLDKVAEWDVLRPRQLATAPDGTLWLIQAGDATTPARILHYSNDGKLLSQALTFPKPGDPTALCCDQVGHLVVADNGPDQQVTLYDPQRGFHPLHVWGVKGGVLAGVKGRIGPLRFNGPVGVGMDNANNLYVCSRNSGVVLQSYAPTNKLSWELQGLEFVDSAAADPGADTNVYTKEEHFGFDYSKPRGQEWSYRGYTRDWLHYPQDPRQHIEFATSIVRRIGGKPFLFGIDMYSDHLLVYRFNGKDEIAIPCGMMAQKHIQTPENWPPQQPAKGAWIWRDKNGDGAFQPAEYENQAESQPFGWGWSVDSRGDVWQAGDANTVRHIPCQGLDRNGSPIYSFAGAKTEPAPAPFNNLQRAEYDPAGDTMYLAGYSNEHRNTNGSWKVIGKVVCRYDHWRTTRVKRWEIEPPFPDQENAPGAGQPQAMSIAGDYLFVVYVKTAEIKVYDTATGTYRGTMRPGDKMSGWVDTPYGISAHQRANGEYILFVEEDWKAKGLVYRWRP